MVGDCGVQGQTKDSDSAPVWRIRLYVRQGCGLWRTVTN